MERRNELAYTHGGLPMYQLSAILPDNSGTNLPIHKWWNSWRARSAESTQRPKVYCKAPLVIALHTAAYIYRNGSPTLEACSVVIGISVIRNGTEPAILNFCLHLRGAKDLWIDKAESVRREKYVSYWPLQFSRCLVIVVLFSKWCKSYGSF